MDVYTKIEAQIKEYQAHRNDYDALNRAANPLMEPAARVLGRDHELAELRLGLRNPEKANVILLGEPGSGKTAIVQGFTYDQHSSQYLTLSVDVERLAQDPNADKDSEMANGLLDLVQETEEYSKRFNVIVILFIDEFHRIAMISPASVEALKPILEHSAENGFRVIAATTFEEYDQWITPNRALDQRLLRMDLPELPREAVMDILRSRAKQYDVLQFADSTIFGEIYDTSRQILISNSQPRAAIDILLNMVGNITKIEYMKAGKLIREYATPEELNINSKYALSRPLLNRVIQRAYGIDIDNRVDVQEVRKALRTKIYNQDQAVEMILSRLEMSLAGFNDPTRPKISFLSTGSTGTGKALRDDELIPTPDGYTLNGELKVGDKVYNRSGRPVSVTGVYHKGERTIYRLTLEDGRTIDSASDHLWTCRKGDIGPWQAVTTKELLDADISQLQIPTNEAVIRGHAKLPIDPIVFGFNLGKETFDNIKDAYPKHVADMHYIPDDYKLASIKQREMLIQGLFDTSARVTKGETLTVTYHTLTKQLVADVREILWSLGINSKISAATVDGGLEYQLTILASESQKVEMFSLSTQAKLGLHLPKLSSIYEAHCDGVHLKSLKKLDEKVPMTCIMIDDREHLYQAGRGHIVTHNTELAKVITEALGIPLKRFDMSRYPRPEDAVEFADQLARAAWSAPNAYILIDEAEKSTRECMNTLLQVLDDARLTASNNPNRVISFTGNIINLTTNLGSEVYQHQQRFGDNVENGKDKDIDTELIYKSLADSPEFETAVLGRIDVIVPFRALPRTALTKIALKEMQFNLSIAETAKRPIFISPDILPYIVIDRTSKDAERGGARDAKRNIKNIVIQKVASYLADGRPEVPITIRLDGTPRFRAKRISEPKAADVMVEECYSKAVVDSWLNQLSAKIKQPLRNEGMFIPKTTSANDVIRDLVALIKKGVTSFKTTVNITKTIIIDSHDSLDIAHVSRTIQMSDRTDQQITAEKNEEEHKRMQ